MDELSKALTEYYDPRTDLLRKQRLHDDLNRFLIDRNSWQIALLAFQQQQQQPEINLTLPPVVIYFLLQVLEHSIRHRDSDPQQIRQILLWLFIHRFDAIPVYVRSKFAFLLVLIARCDNHWLTEEFFQISYHLMETQTLTGLLLLSTTIEEIAQFNEDCTVKRCQQMKALLNQEATKIAQILHLLLKKDLPDLKNALAMKQQVLICLDRLISRLANFSIPLEFIDDLFHYTSTTWSTEALNCIHEILLKQHVPRTSDSLLHATLRHTNQLLHMLNENPRMMANKDKLTEILRTIFSLHFKRCESMDQFPLFDLLTGLYKFTTQQTSQDGFYACLDIWSIFLEYIKTKDESRLMQKENSIEKYLSVLRSLSQDLLQRLHHAQSFSENLEETTDLTDSETATDRYIQECVDLLGKLADLPLVSAATLHALISHLQPDIEQFKTIQRFISVSTQDPSRGLLSLTNESLPACRQVLQGLSNLLYGFARLSNVCLLDDHNQQPSFFQTRLTLVHQFIHLIIYLVQLRVDFLDCSSKEIEQDLHTIQSRAFDCVTSLTPWFSQTFTLHQTNTDFRRMIQETVINIIDTCVPLIEVNTCDKPIALSAAKLLSVMVPQTRQHIAMDQINSIKHLTHRVLQWNVIPNNNAHFQVYKLTVKFISSYILSHAVLAEQFFRTVFQPLNTILHDPTNFFQPHQGQEVIRRSFLDYTSLLSELIESMRMENHKTRQNLFISIQPLILQLNQFLPLIINRDPDCETVVISVLLISFDLLRTQMGVELVQTILQSTFTAFNIDNVRTVLHEAKPKAHSAVSKFLEILTLLLNEPGNTKLNQQFLPIIIDLCITALYPAIRENFGLDIRENYYKLIHHLLINNWRYFFKGNVLTTLNGDIESTAHDQSFLQLMESIAWSFSQADIEQFRQNLSSCNELQAKCGLYTKPIFRQQMSAALLALLLNALLHRSHELCRDDIISTLYSILTNDPNTNFPLFIQHYLEQSNIQAILNEKNKRLLIEHYGRNETDLPSFTQNLNDFIHDYRHYISTSNAA